MSGGKRRGIWIGILAVALVATFVIASLKSGGKSKAAEVEAAVLSRAPIESWVRAPGQIEPARLIDVSSNVTGRVLHLHVEEGQRVASGDLLLELDADSYRSEVAQFRARADAAEANHKLAEAQAELDRENLERQRKLFAADLLAPEGLAKSETDARVSDARANAAREEARSARAQFEQAQKQLEETVFRAPMNGIVVALNVDEGENVVTGTMNNAGTVILTVAELDTMEVEAEVDETDVVGIRVGQTARVLVDALGDSAYPAVVTTVGQSGRSTTASGSQATHFLVRARLTDPPETLRPKMSADLEVRIGRADSTMVVPIQAIVAHPEAVVQGWEERLKRGDKEKRSRKEKPSERDPVAGGSKKLLEGVFVIDDDIARFRRIETGLRSDTHVEATGDLSPGQQIVIGPFRVLRDLEGGDRVSIKKPSEEREESRKTS